VRRFATDSLYFAGVRRARPLYWGSYIDWAVVGRRSAVRQGARLSRSLLTAANTAAKTRDVFIRLNTGLCPVNFLTGWTDKSARA